MPLGDPCRPSGHHRRRFAIFCRPSREATDNFCIDDEVLREEGVTDFSGYRYGDATEEDLAIDLFV